VRYKIKPGGATSPTSKKWVDFLPGVLQKKYLEWVVFYFAIVAFDVTG
jgi:hypothetical protein